MQLRWGAIGCPLLGSAAVCRQANRMRIKQPYSPVPVALFLSGNGGVSSGFSPRKSKALHIYCYEPEENSISDEITLEDKTKFLKDKVLGHPTPVSEKEIASGCTYAECF